MLPLKAARPPAEDWRSRVSSKHHDFFTALLDDPEYAGCSRFRDQCALIIERRPDIALYQIGHFFGLNSKSIWKQKKKLEPGVMPHGRPSVLSPDQSTALVEFIRQRIDAHDPPTLNDVLNFVWTAYEQDILPDTMRKWIQNHTAFTATLGRPMEKQRLEVKLDDIVEYFDTLEEAIRDVPAGLILNLDESGFAKFADARNETVILPKDSDCRFYPVSRREKRATFLLTVAADGRCVKPLIIVPRSTLESEVLLAGYTPEETVFARSANGYITGELFQKYISDVVIPYINIRRHQLRYDGYAVITMDNCSCHTSPEVERLCRLNGVKIVYLPPHSSDQTQPCDLGLFGNLKGAQSRVHPPDWMSVQSRQIIRILSAYRAVCHPLAVTSAFRRAGISTYLRNGRLYSAVTRETCSGLRVRPADWPDVSTDYTGGKERVPIGSGLWGDRQDQILDLGGLFNFKEQLRCADLVDHDIDPSTASALVSTIQQLWDGVIPEEDESDDSDWSDDETDDSEDREFEDCEHWQTGGFTRNDGPAREGGFARNDGPAREGGFARNDGPAREGGFARNDGFARPLGLAQAPGFLQSQQLPVAPQVMMFTPQCICWPASGPQAQAPDRCFPMSPAVVGHPWSHGFSLF